MAKKNKDTEKQLLPETEVSPLVATTLAVFLVIYFAATVFFFILGDIYLNALNQDIPSETLNTYSIISIIAFIDFVFTLVLLAKKKLGFWGLLITSIISINYIKSISWFYAFIPLLLVGIIFSVLQIKYNNKTVWKTLK